MDDASAPELILRVGEVIGGGGEARGEAREGVGEVTVVTGSEASPVEEEREGREEVEEERLEEVREIDSSSRSNRSFSFFLITSLIPPTCGCACACAGGLLIFCKMAALSFCSNSCKLSVLALIVFIRSSFSAWERSPAFSFFDMISNICFCCCIC